MGLSKTLIYAKCIKKPMKREKLNKIQKLSKNCPKILLHRRNARQQNGETPTSFAIDCDMRANNIEISCIPVYWARTKRSTRALDRPSLRARVLLSGRTCIQFYFRVVIIWLSVWYFRPRFRYNTDRCLEYSLLTLSHIPKSVSIRGCPEISATKDVGTTIGSR